MDFHIEHIFFLLLTFVVNTNNTWNSAVEMNKIGKPGLELPETQKRQSQPGNKTNIRIHTQTQVTDLYLLHIPLKLTLPLCLTLTLTDQPKAAQNPFMVAKINRQHDWLCIINPCFDVHVVNQCSSLCCGLCHALHKPFVTHKTTNADLPTLAKYFEYHLCRAAFFADYFALHAVTSPFTIDKKQQ